MLPAGGDITPTCDGAFMEELSQLNLVPLHSREEDRWQRFSRANGRERLSLQHSHQMELKMERLYSAPLWLA